MTMDKCTNPEIGKMLHAYELDTLNDRETDLFEAHLMVCDHCFENLARYAETSEILKADTRIQAVVKERLDRDEQPESAMTLRDKLFHPRIAMILRPAFLLIVIVLLLYPAYLGIFGTRNDVSYLYPIGLSSFRSASVDHHEITADQDIVLSFACPNFNTESRYAIVIGDDNGDVIYDNDHFTNFDKYGIGRVYLPHELLRSGLYAVVITDLEHDTAKTAYKFNIKLKQ